MSSQVPWQGHSVVPLLVVDDLGTLPPVLNLLATEGISLIEIALRTPVALEAISLAAAVPGLDVGAGTVLNPDQAQASLDAGASFGVSPSSHPALLEWALHHRWPYLPGVATATEAHLALSAGFEHVKVYPASTLGGREFLDALHAVFPSLRLMPSGGVNALNAKDYLAHPAVFAVSGSWLTPRKALETGDTSAISKLVRHWRRA